MGEDTLRLAACEMDLAQFRSNVTDALQTLYSKEGRASHLENALDYARLSIEKVVWPPAIVNAAMVFCKAAEKRSDQQEACYSEARAAVERALAEDESTVCTTIQLQQQVHTRPVAQFWRYLNASGQQFGAEKTGKMLNIAGTLLAFILMAFLLFPAFTQARAARTVSCLSNVKQLGLSAVMRIHGCDETCPQRANGYDPTLLWKERSPVKSWPASSGLDHRQGWGAPSPLAIQTSPGDIKASA